MSAAFRQEHLHVLDAGVTFLKLMGSVGRDGIQFLLIGYPIVQLASLPRVMFLRLNSEC
jgi:hypothetical protein